MCARRNDDIGDAQKGWHRLARLPLEQAMRAGRRAASQTLLDVRGVVTA